MSGPGTIPETSAADAMAAGPLAEAPARAPGPAAAPHAPGPDRERPRRALRWLGRVSLVALALAAIGFNGWWYWRNARPLPDDRAIEAMVRAGDFVSAETASREKLRRSPRDGATRLVLARCLAAQKRFGDCARELLLVPEWWPKRHEALHRAAQAFLMIDRARDAEAALLTILDADVLHPPEAGVYHDVSQELMKLYATENRWEDFYVVLWKAYDRAPAADRPRYLAMRVRSELDRVAHQQSLKLERRYFAADPQDFEALRAIANDELALGQRAEALRDITACLKARPEDPLVWRDYLSMLHTLGEVEAFRDALEHVPPAAADRHEIRSLRAQSLERDGDLEGAIQDYEAALERDPNLLNAHYRLSVLLQRLGRHGPAAVHRKRWQELREAQTKLRDVDARYRAALSASIGKTLANAPELHQAVREMAAVCDVLGMARAAEGWYQHALEFHD